MRAGRGFFTAIIVLASAVPMTTSALSASASPVPEAASPGGIWRRAIPPTHVGNFATAFDERRGVWVVAGMSGSAEHGEVWRSPAGAAAWSRGEAANRVPFGQFPVFSAWDVAGDRLIALMGAPFVAWELDGAIGGAWKPLTVEGETPPFRQDPVVTFDPVGRRLFLLGGLGGNDVLDEVWSLSLAPTPRWTRIVTAGPWPAARTQAGVAFDSERQQLVIHGGEVRLEGGGVRSDADDVWMLDLAATPPAWRLVTPLLFGPEGGRRSNLVVDARRDRILKFIRLFHGGLWEMSRSSPGTWRYLGPSAPRNSVRAIGHLPGGDAIVVLGDRRDLWRLDFVTNSWSLIDEGDRGSFDRRMTDAALALDPRDGSVLVIGTRVFDSFANTGPELLVPQLSRYVPGDLGRWESVTAIGEMPTLLSSSAAWDPLRRRWVVVGGYDLRTRQAAGAWVLETRPELAWVPLVAPGSGPVGSGLAVLHDPVRDRLLVLDEDPATRGTFREEDSRTRVWSLSLDGSAGWTLEPINGRVPPGRRSAAMALDQRRDHALLFGGRRFVTSNLSFTFREYDDVWSLDLGEFASGWSEVLPRFNPLPFSLDAAADIDAWSDRLRILGGYLSDSPNLAETFERDSLRALDLATGVLDPVEPPAGFERIPGGRTVFDPVSGLAMHFGLSGNVWEWTSLPRHDVRVSIDRKGGHGRGRSPGDRAPLELVIHGADRFDPATIDPGSATAAGGVAIASPGGSGGRHADVDGDGFADRRFLFHANGGAAAEAIEFRARAGGIRVIGFAPASRMVRTDLGTPARMADSPVMARAPALTARLLRGFGHGSVSRVLVEGAVSEPVVVELYDVRGRLLWRGVDAARAGDAVTIDLPAGSIQRGIVFVRVRSGRESQVLRHVALE